MQTLHFNSFWSSCHLSSMDRNKSKKVTTTTQAPGICMFEYRKGFHVGKQALGKTCAGRDPLLLDPLPTFSLPYSALVLKKHGTKSHFRISQLQYRILILQYKVYDANIYNKASNRYECYRGHYHGAGETGNNVQHARTPTTYSMHCPYTVPITFIYRQ